MVGDYFGINWVKKIHGVATTSVGGRVTKMARAKRVKYTMFGVIIGMPMGGAGSLDWIWRHFLAQTTDVVDDGSVWAVTSLQVTL